MKKKFFLYTLLLAISAAPAIACDICGSGPGGAYLGLLPEFRKRFIGLRFQQNGLYAHLGQGRAHTYLTTREAYQTAELWGATNIGSRFRLTMMIPYNFISRSSQQQQASSRGLGDITVIGYYRLLERRSGKEEKQLSQMLWLGAGIKLPAGRYDPDEKNVQEATQNTFQLGTGSTDLSVHAMYDIRFRQTGLNVNAGYKLNTANQYGYRYGNKLSLNLLAYYKHSFSPRITVTPNAGMLYESSAKDRKAADIRVWETGGRSLMGTAGIELSFARVNIGANMQVPVSQHLGEGKINARNRGLVHLSYSF